MTPARSARKLRRQTDRQTVPLLLSRRGARRAGVRRRDRRRHQARRGRPLLLEQLESRQLLTAVIENFGLVSDTGASNADGVTNDPRVTGIVTGNAANSYTEVRFDHYEQCGLWQYDRGGADQPDFYDLQLRVRCLNSGRRVA